MLTRLTSKVSSVFKGGLGSFGYFYAEAFTSHRNELSKYVPCVNNLSLVITSKRMSGISVSNDITQLTRVSIHIFELLTFGSTLFGVHSREVTLW
jgi:hypothetical protein